MDNQASFMCVNRRCTRETAVLGLCAICAAAIPSTLGKSDRIAARRAATKRNAELQQHADAITAKLKGVRSKYGDDAVHEAILASLVRQEADPIAAARGDARGKLSNARVTARRRAGIEFKYCSHWVPTDPTGDAATREGADRVILQADSFAYATTGRRGAAIDYEGLAAATYDTVENVKVRVAAALDNARPNGDMVKRARATGMDVGSFHIASRDYEADPVGPSTMVAATKRARTLQPARGTGRIK
jgi:hypothetical protein